MPGCCGLNESKNVQVSRMSKLLVFPSQPSASKTSRSRTTRPISRTSTPDSQKDIHRIRTPREQRWQGIYIMLETISTKHLLACHHVANSASYGVLVATCPCQSHSLVSMAFGKSSPLVLSQFVTPDPMEPSPNFRLFLA